MTANSKQRHVPHRSMKCLSRQRWMGIALAAVTLSGCSVLGKANSGRYGAEAFTLTGHLPANYGLKAKPSYRPTDPHASACQRQNYQGDWRTRSFGTTHTIAVQPKAHDFDLALPLTYSEGACTMQLTSVRLQIHGRFGQQGWQETFARGALRVVDHLPANAPGFDVNDQLAIQADCHWVFQLSKAKAYRDELDKDLNCNGAGAFVQYDQLAGKTVNLAVAVNPEEEPYRDNTWIKFPNGWKPCLPKEGWQSCQTPPIFKTFKMNGQTCTVYPGCTE